MIDFLKNNPSVTREQYLWEWTVPQIKLASYDFTHIKYLSEKEKERKKTKVMNSAEDILNDLNMPIFGQTKKQ